MTPLLDVQNVSKRFGAHVLFEDISFSIGEGQHVGLIAKNGTGKSTLLSLLSGKESVDSGSIIFRRDIKVGFLEQQPKFDPEESVLDACFNHNGDPDKVLKAKQVLTQLRITDLSQPIGQLSGGQQKRVALANVLITEPDLLILDEPTNHLDNDMVLWLEEFLNSFRGVSPLRTTVTSLTAYATLFSNLTTTPYIPITATSAIIWRNAKSVLTLHVPRLRVPTICIDESLNGCAANRKHADTRLVTEKRLSTTLRTRQDSA